MKVLEKTYLLWVKNVHLTRFPVKDHTFNWHQVLVVHFNNSVSFFEYALDHACLHFLEIDDPRNQWVAWSLIFIQ